MTAPSVTAQQGVVPGGAAYRLAVVLVAVTIVVIVKGAMVASTGSGMAFADWPLSDGALMPERSLTTLSAFLEHFHRLAGALAGLLSIAVTVFVLPRAGLGSQVGVAALLGLGLIVVQGIIGGVGVLKNLPVATSVLHGTLAQVTVATFAVLAYMLSARWAATAPAPHASARSGRRLCVITVGMLILQTVLGAIARHSGSEHALWTHVGNAFVVFLLVIVASGFAAGRFAHVPGVGSLARTLLGLLVVQVVLGFIALIVRTGKHPENIEHLWRASLISGHVLTGALLTLVGSLLAAHVWRGTSATGSPVEPARA
jgi:cytochrome c oxidase assembly protein subunit 15